MGCLSLNLSPSANSSYHQLDLPQKVREEILHTIDQLPTYQIPPDHTHPFDIEVTAPILQGNIHDMTKNTANHINCNLITALSLPTYSYMTDHSTYSTLLINHHCPPTVDPQIQQTMATYHPMHPHATPHANTTNKLASNSTSSQMDTQQINDTACTDGPPITANSCEQSGLTLTANPNHTNTKTTIPSPTPHDGA